VLWAGSEASPRWPGYFEGAIEAGLGAATRAAAVLSS
jgi:monoamine oxidase